MKTTLLLTLALALAVPIVFHNEAKAYGTVDAVDPRNADGNLSGDVETKQIVKSATAGSSEALIGGLVVAYDTTAADGYTVTRAVPQTLAGQNSLACVTVDATATNDINYHRCISQGFAKVRYNGSSFRIDAGVPACVDASGVVRGCKRNAGATQEGAEATANTGIIPLQTKTDSGTLLPVLMNLR